MSQHPPFPPPSSFAAAPPPAAPEWNGKTNGFSIAALTLALFGCTGVISIVFGVLGLTQSRRNGDKRGRIYAIAALSICALWLLAISVFVIIAVARDAADGPDRDHTGAIRDERSISLSSLRAGDCIKDLDSQTGRYIDVLPCSSPHSSEVVGTYDLPAKTPEATAKAAAEAGCAQRYQTYTGTKDPAGQKVFLFTVRMSELTTSSDRRVLCIADQLSGTTTGSIRH